MLTKITIDKIFTNYKSAAGKEFSKPKVDIYFTKDDKEIKVSCFVNDDSPALSWDKGQEVEIDIFKKGDYLNFKDPAGNLADRVARLEDAVFRGGKAKDDTHEKVAEPADDLPWS